MPNITTTNHAITYTNKWLLSGETSKMHSVSKHIGVLKFHACSNTG